VIFKGLNRKRFLIGSFPKVGSRARLGAYAPG
jgi:hypothetical protein